MRPRSDGHSHVDLPSIDVLKRLRDVNNLSLNDISELYNIPYDSVYRQFKSNNEWYIANKKGPKPKSPPSIDSLRLEYEEFGLRQIDLARLYEVGVDTIRRWLREIGIEDNSGVSHIRYLDRNGVEHYLNNIYESNFAQWLDNEGYNWMSHAQPSFKYTTSDNVTHRVTPDFIVYDPAFKSVPSTELRFKYFVVPFGVHDSSRFKCFVNRVKALDEHFGRTYVVDSLNFDFNSNTPKPLQTSGLSGFRKL